MVTQIRLEGGMSLGVARPENCSKQGIYRNWGDEMFGDEFKLKQIQRRYGPGIHDSTYATLLFDKPSNKLRIQSVTLVDSIAFERLPSSNFSAGQRGVKLETE